MQVRDLILKLEELDPSAEVRLAHQPQYPFEYAIGEVVEVEGIEVIPKAKFDAMSEAEQEEYMSREDRDEVCLEGSRQAQQGSNPVVYIGENGQLGYLPGRARNELGW